MINEDRALPTMLDQAHRLWLSVFHHWHDFEPGDMFESSAETTEW
ncbi:hypothetical protein [Plantactinospora soyae]|uniref:Uncharacterized protein n=1 Tax=Plantactinospora soyae TaxID=1544732 RepID=A0A927MC48_9ACTN|nr:hypothetical protein [Plantactinospora soyae]MBE1490992.1 hypothetical protein [Plantactinospora soyae]